MSGIQPRTLTDAELVRYADLEVGTKQGLPKEWQEELLRRFADVYEATPKQSKQDDRQLELFPTK
jgi:hypothetical protein